jgi:YD repeat-containing protein
MKNILPALALLITTGLHAQYYYNDIIGTREITSRMKTYVDNKVQTVTATGYDGNGTKSSDFNEWQEVRENGTALTITTRNGLNKTILYYRFDQNGRLTSLIDSSSDVQSESKYQYDGSGKLTSISNITKDPTMEFNETEIHQWLYNSKGQPQKVWRILNGKDSLEVRLSTDDSNNISDEYLVKRGFGVDTIYYYYDDVNRITDVVRFNKKMNRLLPDFMFEYDENDRVIQKITTLSSFNMGYLIWRYIYDTRGLKTKEALFNKDKALTGKIDYVYTFAR